MLDTANPSNKTSRRALLTSTGIAIGSVALGSIAGTAPASADSHGSGHSDHHGNHVATPAAKKTGEPDARMALVEVASACADAGDACLAHCFQMFASGDTSMSECAPAVHEMIDACRLLARSAHRDSKHLAEIASLCASICDDCDTHCRKHEKHHEECRKCAEACADCAEGCRAFISA